eukprot:g11693.t1
MASIILKGRSSRKTKQNGFSRRSNTNAFIKRRFRKFASNTTRISKVNVVVKKTCKIIKKHGKGATKTKPDGLTMVDVDKSGSMSGHRDEDANEGVKTVITTSKKMGNRNDCLSIATFGKDVIVPLRFKTPEEIHTGNILKKLAAHKPAGGTCMLDCIKKRIDFLDPSMIRNRGQKYVEHVVISDGCDNSSKTSISEIRAAISVASRTLPNYHLTLVLVGHSSSGKQQMDAIASGKSNVHVMTVKMAKGAFVEACKKWLKASSTRVHTYVKITKVTMIAKSTGSKRRGGQGGLKSLRM